MTGRVRRILTVSVIACGVSAFVVVGIACCGLLWNWPAGSESASAYEITCLALSPDESSVLVGGLDGELEEISTADGRRVRAVTGHPDWILDLACAKESGRVVSASTDRVVRTWIIGSTDFTELHAHENRVVTVDVTRDGAYAVSGDLSGVVVLWKVPEGTVIWTMRHPEGGIRETRFDASGDYIACCGVGSMVRVLRRETGDTAEIYDAPWIAEQGGQYTEEVAPGYSHSSTAPVVRCVAFSPDGQWMASGESAGVARLWSRDSGTLAARVNDVGQLREIEFSADSQTVFYATSSGIFAALDVATGVEVDRHSMRASNVFFVVRGNSGDVILCDGRRFYRYEQGRTPSPL